MNPTSLIASQESNRTGGPYCNTRSKVAQIENLFPLREVLMGGVVGGIGFINAPLTASEVRNFKKEIKTLLEDPIRISNQSDQFLGPSIYTWEELNSILNILFSPEEIQLIRAAGMKIWKRENRVDPQGETKLPYDPPDWGPNDELGRRNMRDYMSLIVRGIQEAVPRTSNAKLAFDSQQEKR